MKMWTKTLVTAAVVAVAAGPMALAPARAEAVTLELTFKDKKFEPATLEAPANSEITLKVKNATAKAMEFESKALKAEKVIAPNGEATFKIKPMKAGSYEFEDEFTPGAHGKLIVK